MAKKVTNEDLARMTAKGFEGVDRQFALVDKGFVGVDKKIEDLRKDMRTGFDRIENLLLRDHLNRIERLEDTVVQLKVKVGMR